MIASSCFAFASINSARAVKVDILRGAINASGTKEVSVDDKSFNANCAEVPHECPAWELCPHVEHPAYDVAAEVSILPVSIQSLLMQAALFQRQSWI